MHNTNYYEMQLPVNNFVNNNSEYKLSTKQKENFKFIVCFREIIENIQTNIFKRYKNPNIGGSNYSVTIISPSVLIEYCKGLKNLQESGIGSEQLFSEIVNAITCINHTELSVCTISKQTNLQKIFFPFETYMSQKMININANANNSQTSLFNNKANIITAEEAARNLLKLIRAFKKLPMYVTVKNKIEKINNNKTSEQQKLLQNEQQQININYINFLIKRLEKQANKLADIASTYLDQYTYKKLKKISKNKYKTRKNII